jgi:hypothetical protein
MTLAREMERRYAPSPTCNASMALTGTGRVIRCDLPKNHLPANDHVGSVRWTAK